MKQISLFLFVKFYGGEGVFSDKLPVNARDVCATINQGTSVDDYQCVREGDELQRDSHCFRV